MIFVIARSRLHYTNPRTILVRPVDLKAGALSQSTTCWFRRAYVCVATAVFFLLTLTIATARELTTFEQYRWQIIGTAALCGIQSILIVVLLVHRQRLRRANVERLQAEQARHVLSGRLINAQERSALGLRVSCTTIYRNAWRCWRLTPVARSVLCRKVVAAKRCGQCAKT